MALGRIALIKYRLFVQSVYRAAFLEPQRTIFRMAEFLRDLTNGRVLFLRLESFLPLFMLRGSSTDPDALKPL